MRLLLALFLAWPAAAQEDMVLVPAGEFLMGSESGNEDEAPRHKVFLPAFRMDRTEVTNADFLRFVRESGSFDALEGAWFRHFAQGARELLAHGEKRYEPGPAGEKAAAAADDLPRRRAASAALRAFEDAGADALDRQASLPVREVTWRDAFAYCRWAGKSLPTEAQWEKAARGTDARAYPWGPSWDPGKARAGLEPEAGPSPVGSFPEGASPYGCLDMAGNVWEWVADWYGEDYYRSSPGSDPKGPQGLAEGRLPGPDPDVDLLRSVKQGRESDTRKVIRGGGFSGVLLGQARYNARTARRLWSNPSYWHPDVGFRCAREEKGPGAAPPAQGAGGTQP